ncbi:DNA polymerase [Vibrio phage K436]
MKPYDFLNVLTLDLEADNREYHGRSVSQFHPDNYVVAVGWSYNGGAVSHRYFNSKEDVPASFLPDLTNVMLIVGHNIKYDLIWFWDDPALTEFFEKGGMIYDTQYGEYLLQGMVQDVHMNAMNDVAEKYGGGCKMDAVKEMWEAGYLTSAIPKDMLVEYLVGSKAVGNPYGEIVGDIDNTWRMFQGQINNFSNMHKNFPEMVKLRMDGLLATTEMEFNGIFCAAQKGIALRHEVHTEVHEKLAILNSYLPEGTPDELDFNWGSTYHKSAIIFGGTVTYQKSVHKTDPDTGMPAYAQKKVKFPLFRGKPIDPGLCRVSPQGVHYLPVPVGVDPHSIPDAIVDGTGTGYLVQDKVKTGKNRGTPKTKIETLPDFDKPKTKLTDFYFTFPGYCTPDKKWETKNTDATGVPIYQTNEKTLKRLISKGTVPFIKDFIRYSKAKKDMDTYYWQEDDKGNVKGGMLTFVKPDGIINHSLNHTSTVTGRLSSSKPNCQNLPRAGGSKVKQMFTSRWGDQGLMAEIDYSQLEVVCLGVLTGDKQLIADLNNGVDFHIKRLSAKLKRDYDELWKLHHVDEDPFIGEERTNAKTYSFQSQYGAGLATIAYDTGMDLADVKALFEADEMLYPGVKPFYEDLDYIRESNSFLTGEHLYIAGDRHPVRRGYWDSPTGTRYCWTQQETPDFIKEKLGKLMGFSPTELKNYPSQGLGGEIMQVMLGKVWRYFIANKRFQGMVKLCNTVHDCVWLDGVKGWVEPVTKAVAHILECVPQVFKQHYGLDVPVPFPVEAEIGSNMFDMHVISHKD